MDLFEQFLTNYSLDNKEVLFILGHNNEKDVDYIHSSDPTVRFIRGGTPLSEISDRNLPSPCEVRGDSHLLLMPYYQEVNPDEHRTMVRKQREKEKFLKQREKEK